MPETIILKRCSKCKQIKPASEFHKNRSQKYGLAAYCKRCHYLARTKYQQTNWYKVERQLYRQQNKTRITEWNRRYTQSDKGKQQRKTYRQNSMKLRAHRAVENALKRRRLPKAKYFQCAYCGKQATQYHHWHGYDREHWLDVIPVCRRCDYADHKSKIPNAKLSSI